MHVEADIKTLVDTVVEICEIVDEGPSDGVDEGPSDWCG